MDWLINAKEKYRFLDLAFKRFNAPYCWPAESNRYSGKDLEGAMYPGTYDCSGLVTSVLFDFTDGRIDRRATWNANRLFDESAPMDLPVPGDLCFYGPPKGLVTHVMIFIGNAPRPDVIPAEWRVFGSSGGDRRTLTPEIAEKVGAKVTGYSSHKYRPDFRGFGRLFK